jgi:hypothetical protein
VIFQGRKPPWSVTGLPFGMATGRSNDQYFPRGNTGGQSTRLR